MYGKGKKLSKFKIQNQYEENKINSIKNSFILKKAKKKKIKKEIRTLFEEADYYKLKRVRHFWNNN